MEAFESKLMYDIIYSCNLLLLLLLLLLFIIIIIIVIITIGTFSHLQLSDVIIPWRLAHCL